MKKITAFITLFCALFAHCLHAQVKEPHYPKITQSHRIEVTKALDASISDSIENLIAPYRQKVDSLISPVVGTSLVAMSAFRPESPLTNWAADAVQSLSKKVFNTKADFTILNIGGFRANMPKGDVTVGDMMQIFPFQNTLAMLDLTGSEVVQLFRDIAAVGGEAISSEVRLIITPDGRLKKARINGKLITSKRIYHIATIDYLLAGNDKLYTLRKGRKKRTSKVTLRDALTSIFDNRDSFGALDGRITIEDDQYQYNHQLFIVHTNDTHSCIEPLSINNNDTAQAFKGGYLRRATLINQLRQEHPDMILLDAGDFSQGSAYYNLFKGEVEIKLMNAMHYEAATIGNHEFDFGLDNMARIFRMAEFPIVCCNYDFTGTPVAGLVKPYTILHHSGLKIGVLGVSPQLAGLVDAHCYGGTRYTQPATAAQPIIDLLRNKEQCDFIICLSHLGWGNDPDMDPNFISHTRGIDLVIGGHSHTYMTEPQYVKDLDGKPVPVNQMGKNARFVGTIEMKF